MVSKPETMVELAMQKHTLLMFGVLRQPCPTVRTVELPLYPDVRDTSELTSVEYPELRVVSHLVGLARLEDVADFYRQAMLEKGWEYGGLQGSMHYFRYHQGGCKRVIFCGIRVDLSAEGTVMHAIITIESLLFGR